MKKWWMEDDALDDALSQLGDLPSATPIVTPEQILAKAAALSPAVAATGLAGWKLIAALGTALVTGFGGGIVVQEFRGNPDVSTVVEESTAEPSEQVEEEKQPKAKPIAAPVVKEDVEKKIEPSTEQPVEPPPQLTMVTPVEEPLAKNRQQNSVPTERNKRENATKKVNRHSQKSSSQKKFKKSAQVVVKEPKAEPQMVIQTAEIDDVVAQKPKNKSKVDPAKTTTTLKQPRVATKLKLESRMGFQMPISKPQAPLPVMGVGLAYEHGDQFFGRLASYGELGLPLRDNKHFLPSLQVDVGVGYRGKKNATTVGLGFGLHRLERQDLGMQQRGEMNHDDDHNGSNGQRRKALFMAGPQLKIDLGDKFWMMTEFQRTLRLQENEKWLGINLGVNFPVGGKG